MAEQSHMTEESRRAGETGLIEELGDYSSIELQEFA